MHANMGENTYLTILNNCTVFDNGLSLRNEIPIQQFAYILPDGNWINSHSSRVKDKKSKICSKKYLTKGHSLSYNMSYRPCSL